MKKVIITGGGIAGLTCAILLQDKGFYVHVFEKKKYPFHRVCGEYVSNETLPLLNSIGIFPEQYGASSITDLELSTIPGRTLKSKLPLGGFGLSRYVLDNLLYQKALQLGVQFTFEKVTDITFQEDEFYVQALELHRAPLVISSHGKRSNIDQKKGRKFFYERSPYMGIKYHIRSDIPKNLIRLDNFQGGYAGTCKIEADRYNFCYLSKTSNLKKYSSIGEMEENLLAENPFIKTILRNSDFIHEAPEVINEISFEHKTLFENHLLFCGDSAGMITPLCGNGIAMAMHSAKILADSIIRFYTGGKTPNRDIFEKYYEKDWRSHFESRLRTGRWIQSLFGNDLMFNMAIRGLQHFPSISQKLIEATHGKRFNH